MDKVRVALIGCGGICSGFHAQHLKEFEDVEVVAVADPIEERRDAMAKLFGAQRKYANHNDLYDKESAATLDAVYIMVEPTAHENTELRAIDLGLPFLVEKPMTMDLELADKIVTLTEEKKIITAVGFQDRYLDVFNMVKDELPKHKPGGLVYGSWVGGIPMVWWWMRKDTCGGQLVEQNIHLLDGLRYLFGEPRSVYATASRGIVQNVPTAERGLPDYDTDDHSTAVITFDNNYTVTLVSGCYLTPESQGHTNGLQISLEDMTIQYRLRESATFISNKGTFTYRTQQNQGLTEDRTFIDAIKSGDGSKIRSSYADALKSLRLGFAANESMDTGKVITLK